MFHRIIFLLLLIVSILSVYIFHRIIFLLLLIVKSLFAILIAVPFAFSRLWTSLAGVVKMPCVFPLKRFWRLQYTVWGPVLGHFFCSTFIFRATNESEWKAILFPKVASFLVFRPAEFRVYRYYILWARRGDAQVGELVCPKACLFTATRITWFNSSLYFIRIEGPNEPVLGIKNVEW